jgi:arabinofuranosyltransferase
MRGSRSLPYLVLVVGLAITWFFGRRFNYLLDDAFISLRYAKNLFQGAGILYNPGEPPVEGYTNFLWVLLETAHFPFTDYPEHLLLLYNKLAALGIVVVIWRTTLRLGADLRPWVWLSVLLVACHETLHAWMGGGLETTFFTLLVTIAVCAFLIEEAESSSRAGFSGLFMGLALLTRPEAYLVAFLCFVAMLLRLIAERGRTSYGRRVLHWALICAALAVPHLAFRRLYYHDWLPNTFYAKVPGTYFSKGIPYVQLFLDSNYFSWLVLPVAALGTAWLLRREPRRGRQAALLGALVVSHTLYVAAVGGDHFEFRLLLPTVPLTALWLTILAAGIATRASANLGGPGRAATICVLAASGAALVVRLLFVTVDLPFAERLWRMRYATSIGQRDANYAEAWRPAAEWLLAFGRQDERLAVDAAGVIPYVSQLPTLDTLGLNDRVVGRQAITKRGEVVAHEKHATWDYLVDSKVMYHLDDLGFKERPEEFPSRSFESDDRIVVELLTGQWMQFQTTQEGNALRRRLRARGAIVFRGPSEDPSAVADGNALADEIFAAAVRLWKERERARKTGAIFEAYNAIREPTRVK